MANLPEQWAKVVCQQRKRRDPYIEQQEREAVLSERTARRMTSDTRSQANSC